MKIAMFVFSIFIFLGSTAFGADNDWMNKTYCAKAGVYEYCLKFNQTKVDPNSGYHGVVTIKARDNSLPSGLAMWDGPYPLSKYHRDYEGGPIELIDCDSFNMINIENGQLEVYQPRTTLLFFNEQ